MKRFASLDFLRGVAIIMMLFVHIIADLLDIDSLIAQIDYIPLVNILALVILPFIGGLAGFFLLVSAISNSISMTKFLMKGKSAGELALKQFLGGFILYLFAMASEAAIGYHGGIMGNTRHLNDIVINWDIIFTDWGVFETIHTIAWCIMINGLIHGLLSRNEGWKNPKKQMKIYGILTILVIVVTPFVWIGISKIYPGFPWGTLEGGFSQSKPHLFKNTFLEVIAGGFFGALAGPMEPIFPYLAVSFIGTMVGIGLAQEDKTMFKWFFKFWFTVGLVMFLIGLVGLIVMMMGLMGNFDRAIEIYRFISFHRHWAPDNFPELTWLSYLWQFLSVNGFSLLCTLTIIYLVEGRGKGEKFGERTKFVRRFGFIALTCYNMQYIYPFVNFIVPRFMGLAPYAKTLWGGVFIQMAVTFLIYHVILLLWERINYRGSLEWFMTLIASFLIPSKKKSEQKKRSWKERADLAVDGGFYNVEWVNLVEANENYHTRQRDSLTVFRFALLSFTMPLFIPFTCGTLFMALKAKKTEEKNKHNSVALIVSLIGVILTVSVIVVVVLLTPDDLGFYLMA
ncbi:MAG: hypothetical protein ACTSVZ_08810 [Promethearchaeota archaeon]